MRTLALLFYASIATPAWCEPAVRLETAPGGAFTMNTPVVEAHDGQLRISGSICRRAFAAGEPRYVRVERRSAAGELIATRSARIRGMPGYRGGCGFYALLEPALAHGEIARLSVRQGRSDR